MEMKQAVKFTFDTCFDEGHAAPAARVQPKARFTDEDLERARSEAYAEGFQAGHAQAAERSERETGDAMHEFARNAASLLAALEAESAALRSEAVSLALGVAGKLAPALVASRPEAEIQAVLRDCLSHLSREPHVVLRVAGNLVERLKETVDRMAHERGMSGRIILLGQSDIAEGDCVIEWADGGVARDSKEIEKEISAIVSRYVESLSGPRDSAHKQNSI